MIQKYYNTKPIVENRLIYLDSSRGMAAMAVLLSHFILVFTPWFNETGFAHSPLHVVWDGPSAVMYFFIHSGFILTYRLQQSEFSLNIISYFAFLIRRVFRIYPLFFATLILSWIIIHTGIYDEFEIKASGNWLHTTWQNIPSVGELFKQAVLIIRIPNNPDERLIPQDWSLTTEMAVSVLLPFLFTAMSGRGCGLLVVVYVAIQLLGLDKFVFDFTMGIAVTANYERFRNWWKVRKFYFKLMLLVLAFFIMTCDHILPEQIFNTINHVLIHAKAWGCLLLFLILLSSSRIQSILSFKPFVLLGKSSYGIYLVHLTLLIVIFSLPVFSGLPVLILLAMFIMVTSVISYAFHLLVEKPMIRLGKIFSLRIGKRVK